MGAFIGVAPSLRRRFALELRPFFLPLMKKKQGKEHEGGELQNNGYTLDFWTSMREFF